MGQQFLAWQRQVIDQRLDHLRTQAGLDYDDPGRIAAYANAGGNAGSSIWRSAIEGALNDGDHNEALGLYDRAKDRLVPADNAALGPLIAGAREREAGKAYVAGIVPSLPQGLDALEAAHAAATSKNNADWSDDPSQRATNQHFIDVQFGKAKQDAEQARADLNQSVNDWLARPDANGGPQTARPPLPVWSKLDPTTQKDVDAVLASNARGLDPADAERNDWLQNLPYRPITDDVGSAVQTLPWKVDPRFPDDAADLVLLKDRNASGAAPNVEPPPGSPEFQAAEDEARKIRPQWDDLTAWQKLGVAFERLDQYSKKRGATLAADSAARCWQQVDELQRRKAAGETLNVTEELYLQRNRNVASDVASAVGRLVEAQNHLDELPSSAPLRKLLEASTVDEAAQILRDNPGEIAKSLGIESVPALTVGIAAMGVLGPVGGAAVLTGTSGLQGYANGLIGALSKAGVDVSRPDEIVRALQDRDLMDRVRGQATTQGAIEAGTTLAMTMVGGRGGPKPVGAGERTAAEAESASLSASVPAKLTPAEQLAKNRLAGTAWEDAKEAELKSRGLEVGKQITIKTVGGVSTRVDFVTRDPKTGNIECIECKASATARLTPQQTLAFPRISRTGGAITGAGKPGFPDGTRIPSKEVQISRPPSQKDVP